MGKRTVRLTSTAIINKQTGVVLMRTCSQGKHLRKHIQKVCKDHDITEKDLKFSQSELTNTLMGG